MRHGRGPGPISGSRGCIRSLLLALVLGAILGPSTPQVQGQLVLDRRFPEAFGMVGPLRELSDGRVMVADPLGQVLAVIDFEADRADTLGRLGQGPQEYGQPDAVYPMAGDTSLLVDLGNARLATIDPDGEILHSISMGQETASGGLIVALPNGVDEEGHLYFRSEAQPMGDYPDSAALLRFDPSTRVLDTLSLLKVPELPPPPLPGGGGLRGKAAEPQDDWAVGPDGRVVIIRSEGYWVEWLSPGGGRVIGSKHDYDAVRIRNAEKKMWIAEQAGSNVRMITAEAGTVSVFRSGEEGARSVVNMYGWPRVFPAVKPGRALVAPNGEAWVERYTSAGEAPLVDRFDEHGLRVGEIRLPMGRRVAGFGRGVVFLIFTDEFHLQWIERYRWER